MDGNSRKSLIVLGIFTLASIGMLFFLSMKVGGLDVEERVSYFAEFDDATGLVTRSAIKISGITVGTVGSMALTDSYTARVELRMDPSIKLYNDAIVSIRAKSLLGEMFIGIKPGTAAAGQVQPNATIQDARAPLRVADLGELVAPLIKDVDPEAFSRALGAIADFLDNNAGKISKVGDDIILTIESVGRMVRGNESKIGKIINNADRGTVALVQLLDAHGKDLGEALESLAAASKRIDKLMADLASTDADGNTTGAMQDATELLRRLNRVMALMEKFDVEGALMVVKRLLQEEGVTVSLMGYDEDELREQLAKYKALQQRLDQVTAEPQNAAADDR